MITDKRTLAKFGKLEEQYTALRFETISEVPVEMLETREHFRVEPSGSKLKWRSVKPGARWGDSGVTAWFRGDVKLPRSCKGKPVLVRARTGGETLFLVDGVHMGVFDGNHPCVMMTPKATTSREYHLAFETYAGHTFPGTQPFDTGPVVGRKSRAFDGIEIVLERKDVSDFLFDFRTLRQLMDALGGNSLRRAEIPKALADVWATVDAVPAESGQESWRPKLALARDIMAPLLAKKNSDTTPTIGLVSASHIDTAWLWTIAETWRKCARTFSSMINLLEQYPEMIFLQPAPCHAEVMKHEYPGIFQRMQKLVAEGRWEPNGAMWIEPDCNVPSGEAFVRQLLVGQRATREMFGYTADTLWLPDVFGYSAALPQLLQGAGVEFFATTKIAWNDTTRFPYDTFDWQGIDGTTVVSHYNWHHSWVDPESLIGNYNWLQHKDVDDRRLCAYGFGDGGGGPMAEMAEMAKRVEDLEGCPKSVHTTLTDFMVGIRDEIDNRPTWVGELYLEMHRGTLTSIAQIKRGNRKHEFAMRDAEFLGTLAKLQGTDYPADELLALWKELLINQFHDILPGSSIAEVNDEAIRSFADCIERTEDLSGKALRAIAGPKPRSPKNLMVVNTLSWDRAGELVLSGVPDGLVPADDVVSQCVTDIDGDPQLVISGLDVPALGAAILPVEPADVLQVDSPFTVDGDTVTTPHATVRFDDAGRIVSLVDAATGREVVASRGALNTLLLGEDVPFSYDNWDVDADQELKMVAQANLVKREVVADGPLQLRIRCEHAIGDGSTLTQDVVFHSASPQIDFETAVDWSEKHKLLKASFDIDVLADSARHEIQYGHVTRPTHRNLPEDRARFEVCAHKWTDLSENGFGVALLNDCKYGISVHGSTLGLSLLKSGTHPDPRGDEGRHLVTYSLLPHAGDFSVESVVRSAYELNVPLVTIPVGAKAEPIPSLVNVDAPNVIVESIKWAEEGDAFVVRLYDAQRLGGTATVSFGVPVKSVTRTNLLEEDPKKLRLKSNSVELYVKPFEVITLRCEASSPRSAP